MGYHGCQRQAVVAVEAFLKCSPLDLKTTLNLDGGPIACQSEASRLSAEILCEMGGANRRCTGSAFDLAVLTGALGDACLNDRREAVKTLDAAHRPQAFPRELASVMKAL